MIDHLPLGAEVTVTEIYSGATYDLKEVCSKSQTVIIDSIDQEKKVEFTNICNDKARVGKSLVNHYTYSNDQYWVTRDVNLAYEAEDKFYSRKIAYGPALGLFYDCEIIEQLSGLDKHITVINSGDRDEFARLKVFAPQEILDNMDIASDSGKWEYKADDGYVYYKDILAPGEETEPLIIDVNIPEGYTQDFNIIVVIEVVPALNNDDGTLYADWELEL